MFDDAVGAKLLILRGHTKVVDSMLELAVFARCFRAGEVSQVVMEEVKGEEFGSFSHARAWRCQGLTNLMYSS